MKNKKLFINIVICIVSFITTIATNFFVAPYITNHIGEEAYGFISLATNFTNIASIATLAINSMAMRFISVSVFKEDYENANKYFTSVLFANIFMILFLILPSIICVIFLDKFISISPVLVYQVKILFAIIFLNFFVSLLNSTYSVAPFAADRVELNTLRTMESGLLKFGFMLLLFWIFGANIIIVGISYLVATLYLLLFNVQYVKKLLPFIKIKRKYFEFSKIIEIVKSGIWNIITKVGQILSDGLDLIISNIFISPIAMGLLSISKTISSSVSLLTNSLTNIFQPKITKYYAKKDERITKEVNFSMRIMALFTNILLIGIIAFSYEFFKLWMPNSDCRLLANLTIITLSGNILSNSINVLYTVFTITNKIKANSLVICGQGFLNILIVYLLLKFSNLNPIYVVASVSIITGIIKNLTFTPIYAAKCLNANPTIFYSSLIRATLSSAIMFIAFKFIGSFLTINSWINLLGVAVICCIVGFIISLVTLFNKDELGKLIKTIKNIERKKEKHA